MPRSAKSLTSSSETAASPAVSSAPRTALARSASDDNRVPRGSTSSGGLVRSASDVAGGSPLVRSASESGGSRAASTSEAARAQPSSTADAPVRRIPLSLSDNVPAEAVPRGLPASRSWSSSESGRSATSGDEPPKKGLRKISSLVSGSLRSVPRSLSKSKSADDFPSAAEVQRRVATVVDEALDLSSCELASVPLAATLASVTSVTSLELSFNKFAELPDVSAFAQLKVLNLNGNRLCGLPSSMQALSSLRELHLNGNKLPELPDSIGALTSLEKLSVANNCIASVSAQVGAMQQLEDLHLDGNPLAALPREIGRLRFLELLNVSRCRLRTLPDEFTWCTNLLELDLAANQLEELPATFGRLRRLVKLDVSDNRLRDLPLSIGHCQSLDRLGAGINLERNPIEDPEMLYRFKIGPDHLTMYLQHRMYRNGGQILEDGPPPWLQPDSADDTGRTRPDLPTVTSSTGHVFYFNPPPPKALAKSNSEPNAISSSASAPVAASPGMVRSSSSETNLDAKIQVLRTWAATTCQHALLHVTTLRTRCSSSETAQAAMAVGPAVGALNAEIVKLKPLLPTYDSPKPVLDVTLPKLEQLKSVLSASLDDAFLAVKAAQLLVPTSPVAQLMQLVTALKSVKANVLDPATS
eukprot:TRINITY_DN10696_c0_g1_i1.p1 TRINITY_DN10696_c0_g1~~TRINITY_DN10696_c0_g1_i1.p1  ORF type:complete len:688 (+),score=242.37 TRINITY_DN10696_c0_g1_i1:140-2065(+)